MAYVEIVDRKYKDWDSIRDVLRYIFREEATSVDYTGGYGVIFNGCYFVDSVIQQFETVKKVYNKENYRMLKHFYIDFDPKEAVNCIEAVDIGWEFIKYFKGYQIVFAVHTNTDNVHIHIVLNTTNVFTGNNYNAYFEAWKLNEYLNDIMSKRHNIL